MPDKEFSDIAAGFFKFIADLAKTFVSWPTVVFVGGFALRAQLKDLIKSLASRLTKLKLGSAEAGFAEPITQESPLGQTNVSAVSTSFQIDHHTFYSKRWGFQISYPTSGWELVFLTNEDSVSLPNQIIVLFVNSLNPIDGFQANINVIVQPVGDVTVAQYAAATVQQLPIVNGRVIAYDTDDSTNGFYLNYSARFGEPSKPRTEHVVRGTIARGLAILATSTIREGSRPIIEEISQLRDILNSFQVTNGEERTDCASATS